MFLAVLAVLMAFWNSNLCKSCVGNISSFVDMFGGSSFSECEGPSAACDFRGYVAPSVGVQPQCS